MRTAAIMLVAVLTAAAVGANAHGGEIAASASYDHSKSIEVPVSDRTPPYDSSADNSSVSSGKTAEIPPAEQTTPGGESADLSNLQQAEEPEPDSEAESQVPPEVSPHVYSLQDFVNQGLDESPIGVELREDCSRLATHERICGLAVLGVRNGSPADRAGVHRYTALGHDLLDGASVAAALVFPPAIIAVAMIDQSGIGESFDLIVGVDGRRVRHILDFQDLTANIKPGDILYLTVVRSGKRLQLPVHVEPETATARN